MDEKQRLARLEKLSWLADVPLFIDESQRFAGFLAQSSDGA